LGKVRPTFSKPGRPRENVVERRLDIYERVAPLLAERGMRGLSMEQAARAAHVSVGTLYRYFPSKRSLVLYGTNPEPVDLLCERFIQSSTKLEDRHAMRIALAAFIVHNIELMRPSVDAAIQLGPEVVRGRLDRVARQALEIFPALLAMGMPADDGRTPEQVERVVRRTIVSTLMEKEFESEALRRTFEGVLAGG
jgi:AcrR family transcriptional regulator